MYTSWVYLNTFCFVYSLAKFSNSVNYLYDFQVARKNFIGEYIYDVPRNLSPSSKWLERGVCNQIVYFTLIHLGNFNFIILIMKLHFFFFLMSNKITATS